MQKWGDSPDVAQRAAPSHTGGAMTRKSATPAAPAGPRFVGHPKRLEWGLGQIVGDQYGLVRVAFADGTTRSFRGDVLESAPAPEVTEGAMPSNDVAVAPAVVAKVRRAPRKVART